MSQEIDQLKQKIAQLEDRINQLQQNQPKALVDRFTQLGLTRRQAMQAAGLVAGGASFGSAAMYALTGRAEAQGTGKVGTSTNPLAAVFTDQVNHNVTETAGAAETYATIISAAFSDVSDGLQQTTAVSNSAKSIYTLSATDSDLAALFLIQGTDSDETPNERFADVVITMHGFTPETIHSFDASGSPPGRTYSVSGDDLQVALASARSFQIRVRAFEFGRAGD